MFKYKKARLFFFAFRKDSAGSDLPKNWFWLLNNGKTKSLKSKSLSSKIFYNDDNKDDDTVFEADYDEIEGNTLP